MGLYQCKFQWRVHADGYYCADETLFERRFHASSVQYTSYYPLQKYTGLFQDFARLQLTEEAIVSFANNHGFLGASIPSLDASEFPDERSEYIRFWIKEISEMSMCVELWDAIQADDERKIAEHIERFPTEQKPRTIQQGDTVRKGLFCANRIVLDDLGIESAAGICPAIPNPSNVIQEALNTLQFSINLHIFGLWQTGLTWDESEQRMGICIVPTSLLGAMWLQFAEAVSGRKGYGSCPGCGRYFEVHTENARSDKTYCSEACKSKNYRDRKARALELHTKGMSLEEIAEALSSKPETVAKWIAYPGRRRKQK